MAGQRPSDELLQLCAWGNAECAQRLYDASKTRLLSLQIHWRDAQPFAKSTSASPQINEDAWIRWINSVTPSDTKHLKLLSRFAATCEKRFGTSQPPRETRSSSADNSSSQKDFFISYNSADKSWAEWIAWRLEEAGYSTIIQAWDFRPGGDFVAEMHRAATGSRRTIAVLSDNYLNAEFTLAEWTKAFARDPNGNERTLLPVRVSLCEPTGLLSTRIYVDLVGLSATEAARTLHDALADRGKPKSPPEFPGASGCPVTKSPESAGHSFPGRESTALSVWKEKLVLQR